MAGSLTDSGSLTSALTANVNCTTTAVLPFCESMMYGGIDTPEYMNAFTSLPITFVGLFLFYQHDIREVPGLIVLCNAILMSQGVGSFLHHWTSRQSAMFLKLDFYPILLLLGVFGCTLFTDTVRLVGFAGLRRFLTTCFVGCIIGFIIVGLAVVDSSTQDWFLFIASALCIGLLLVTVCAAQGCRKVKGTRWRFTVAALQGMLPFLGAAYLRNYTETICLNDAGKAQHLFWVHGIVWHLGVAYSAFHVIQCLVFITAEYSFRSPRLVRRWWVVTVCELQDMTVKDMVKAMKARHRCIEGAEGGFELTPVGGARAGTFKLTKQTAKEMLAAKYTDDEKYAPPARSRTNSTLSSFSTTTRTPTPLAVGPTTRIDQSRPLVGALAFRKAVKSTGRNSASSGELLEICEGEERV